MLGGHSRAKNPQRFIAVIRERFSFLFADHGAQVVEDKSGVSPHVQYVTVAAGELLFRFTRDYRNEGGVAVASKSGPERWINPWHALVTTYPDRTAELRHLSDLWGIEGVLKQNLGPLQEALLTNQLRTSDHKANVVGDEGEVIRRSFIAW